MALGQARQAASPVLRLEGVSKSYGAVRAVDNVSFEVHPGEFVALLGPNGAGKTTLFQMLSGLFVPDAGRVLVHGFDMARAAVRALRDIGIVFQQPTLDLDLSVRMNLRFHAQLHGLDRRQTDVRVAEELGRMGLSDVAERPTRSLSGGNRRKVELARALLHRPGLLLMDEATVGLDPVSRRSLLRDVHALCATRGMGVLWATHLVDEAEGAQRVLILNRGRLLHAERPEDLIRTSGQRTLAEAFLELTGHGGSNVVEG